MGEWRLLNLRLILAIILPALLCAACPNPLPEFNPAKYAARSQGEDAPEKGTEPIDPEFVGKREIKRPELDPMPDKYSLANLVDIALRNSPSTRQAWAEGRAAAAGWAASRSSYWPQLDGSIEGAYGRIPSVQGGRSYATAGATLQYLLLDFGGRSAEARAAREALVAANWNHNQTIQDVLRDVPQAYHTYMGDIALERAAVKNLEDATTTLRSTEARMESGVSTIADVLQARASADQARLDLATRKGAVKISKGNLATAVGWTADTDFEVAAEMKDPPLRDLSKNVGDLVKEAKEQRPAVGAAQASVRQALADVDYALSQPYPTLGAGGIAQWQRANNAPDVVYYGGFKLSIPIFYGFKMQNEIRKAKAELEAARAELQATEQTIVQDVWDAYQNFNTAIEQYRASRTLLASAAESYAVSLGRYRQGAADITELLNAQNTLASARAQLIDARMALFNQYAELLHAVGGELPPASPEWSGLEERDVAYGEDR
jgi:outer membrane protein TolC